MNNKNSGQSIGTKKPLVPSVVSDPSESHPGFIPPHGGYQDLLSYQKAQIVFDAIGYFCNRFIDKRDRTYDQMVLDQQVRSLGKAFLKEGGLREAMTRARVATRNNQWRTK